MAALNVKLTKEEVEEVRRIAAEADSSHGDRYPPVLAKVLFGDTPALVE